MRAIKAQVLRSLLFRVQSPTMLRIRKNAPHICQQNLHLILSQNHIGVTIKEITNGITINV